MRWPGMLVLFVLMAVGGCTRKPPAPANGVGKNAGTSAPALVPVTQASLAFAMPRPQTPAGWADQLQSGDQFARAEAARELGGLGKEGFGYLYKGMQSGSWEMRLACLRAAPREEIVSRPRELVPLLTQMLSDSQPELQKYAAVRLGWFGAGARSAFPILKQILAREDDPQVRQEVMEAILAIHDSPALLGTLLRDPDPFLRKSVATRLAGMALHGMPIDAAGPALQSALENESNPEIRVVQRAALDEMRRGRR